MRLIRFVFFSNYFLGLLAILLSVEASSQLGLPFNSPAYYVCLFSWTVVYYTTAYVVPKSAAASRNPRSEWYRQHRVFVRCSQWFFSGLGVASGIVLAATFWRNNVTIPVYYWLAAIPVPFAALLYYGFFPALNLRSTGWLKPFVIGFVWAGVVTLFPVMAVRMEQHAELAQPALLPWFFLKNWMFCTVNAIMFDMKDYADDANRQLKTFVVRVGLRRTIFYILMPLLALGLASFLIFASYRDLSNRRLILNGLPFLIMFLVAWSLQNRRRILFYLIVIDGLLLVKACCGIAGVYWTA